MAFDANEQLETDLGSALEGEWGKPVELTGPDGIVYKTSANSPDPLNPDALMGQALKVHIRIDPETGQPIVIGKPAITLRTSSLTRVPAAGEDWFIRFPTDPSRTAALKDYVLTGDRAPEEDNALGIITFYPTKVVQC